jgi:hypothetical protein
MNQPEGRSTPAGHQMPVHPNHFAEAIEAIADIHAYQVIEKADGIDIAIVAPTRDHDEIAAAIKAAVRRRLEPLDVAHTPLHVRTVQQIPRPDAVSGKFKLIRARAQHAHASAQS